ncbi:PREDICTED: fibroblast growth factor-binding protein 1-like [Galeopterus variegatus]|uniref:Fibroblast growth factor-binding protein 1-like n=1 Tax=Galeopterus variegatus TaxID=482537 RepID=A0ABM0R5J9_GALVR|nr:PREDICTED: fibroblast growth factor-binding protein 1-like [Galeopterus variegatus]
MRIHSLTLLSFLLLATQVLLMHVQKELKIKQGSAPDVDRWVTLGPPRPGANVQQSEFLDIGSFTTSDQAKCRGSLAEKGEGVAVVKIDCTQNSSQFSCVFEGNPTSCLASLEHIFDYWRQIIESLRLQKNICGDSSAKLTTSVCGSNFEESNLKLVSSTLLNH